MKKGYVYIMSNKKRTTNYVGVTNDIEFRVLQHKTDLGSAFTKKYKLYDLIYLEEYEDISKAIEREKQLKKWHKSWKWNLVKSINPDLIDIANNWFSKVEMEAFRKINKEH